jgi:hypothetical protein
VSQLGGLGTDPAFNISEMELRASLGALERVDDPPGKNTATAAKAYNSVRDQAGKFRCLLSSDWCFNSFANWIFAMCCLRSLSKKKGIFFFTLSHSCSHFLPGNVYVSKMVGLYYAMAPSEKRESAKDVLLASRAICGAGQKGPIPLMFPNWMLDDDLMHSVLTTHHNHVFSKKVLINDALDIDLALLKELGRNSSRTLQIIAKKMVSVSLIKDTNYDTSEQECHSFDDDAAGDKRRRLNAQSPIAVLFYEWVNRQDVNLSMSNLMELKDGSDAPYRAAALFVAAEKKRPKADVRKNVRVLSTTDPLTGQAFDVTLNELTFIAYGLLRAQATLCRNANYCTAAPIR